MNQPKRIFIIGHSGAGKGVLAQGVAEKLGWKFIDADFSLVPSIGRTINDILGKQFIKSVIQNVAKQLCGWQRNYNVSLKLRLICISGPN